MHNFANKNLVTADIVDPKKVEAQNNGVATNGVNAH